MRHGRLAPVAICALVVMVAGMVPTAMDIATAGDGNGGRDGGPALWHAENILTGASRINAVAVGDLDPAVPGNESASATDSGMLWLTYHDSYKGRAVNLWNASGRITSLATGEMDPATPGAELIAGLALPDGTGGVQLISGVGAAASSLTAYSSTRAVLAVGTGEVGPAGQGGKFVSLDAGGNVVVTTLGPAFRSSQTVFWADGATCLLVADLEPSRPGDEVAVGTVSGALWEIYWDGAWLNRSLWVSDEGIERIAFGDADPVQDGPELMIAGMAGELTLMERFGDSWSGKTIWRFPEKMEGIDAGDLAPEYPGKAIYAGGSKNLSRLSWDGARWNADRIWGEEGACADLLVADIDATHPGGEILIGGAGGNLTCLGYYHPGLQLIADEYSKVVTGERVSFALNVRSVDKLQGSVRMTASGLPPSIGSNFSATTIDLLPPQTGVMLNLTIPGSFPNAPFTFRVMATYQSGLFDSIELNVSVNRSLTFELTLTARNPSAEAGKDATYLLSIRNTGNLADRYNISARTGAGWKVSFPNGNTTRTIEPNSTQTVTMVVSVPSGTAGRTTKLSIEVRSGARPENIKTASMRVVVPSTGPCVLFLIPAGIVGVALVLRWGGLSRKHGGKPSVDRAHAR